MIVYKCHGGENQRWILDTDGRIISKLNYSKCLDVRANDAVPDDVVISDCNGATHQSWTYRSDGRLVNNAFPSLFVGVPDCLKKDVDRYAVKLEELDETGDCFEAQIWVKNPSNELEIVGAL